MTDTHRCHHVGPYVAQRDYDPEGTLREPDRSDDREQVIYEGHYGPTDWDGEPIGRHHPPSCPYWDCHPQLGPTADNH